MKALFRRGKLWLTLGEVDKARVDLVKARTLDPSSTEISHQITALHAKESLHAAKQKQMYSKMLGK